MVSGASRKSEGAESHLGSEHRALLADWFEENKRDLPWRNHPDPWHIWLSEVILQQTRVDQGLPYFNRFVERYSTVADLAEADLDEVLLAWEGLGYYSRCRNLHCAARHVVDVGKGHLPESYEEWLTLPGVGPYTAAAVSSMAFGQAHAVVDGNVIRVLTRLHAFENDVTTSASKKTLQLQADAFLDHQNPGRHNEAMMELGALVCLPKSPRCKICPLRKICLASAEGTPEKYPVKRKKAPIPHHDIAVGIIRDEQTRIYIQQRDAESMLGGLWEFPGGKVESGESFEDACQREVKEETGLSVRTTSKIATIKHAYSHFRITLHAYECHLTSEIDLQIDQPHAWIAKESFADYAFPRANRKLLDILSGDPF